MPLITSLLLVLVPIIVTQSGALIYFAGSLKTEVAALTHRVNMVERAVFDVSGSD